MALMPLNDAQRGRLLAFAWKDSQFKDDFEKDPAAALKNFKNQTYSIKPNPDELRDMGLDPDPNVKDRLVNLEVIPYPADFRSMTCPQLKTVIKNGDPPMAEDDWSWDGIVDATATYANPDPPDAVLELKHWSRIYARIWMDDRIDDLPDCEQEYGPQQRYREKFEVDPAAVVEAITIELANKGINIPYIRGTTRLFTFRDKPDTWNSQQLEKCVKTGKLEGLTDKYPLQWICKKCC